LYPTPDATGNPHRDYAIKIVTIHRLAALLRLLGQTLRAETESLTVIATEEPRLGFEAVFRAQYPGVARLIAVVIRDPTRAEELAVEVFLKFWRSPAAQGKGAQGWLRRTAVRKGLDELRRRARRARYERWFYFGRTNPTPEEMRGATEQQERVRTVLATMNARQAEMLLLRNEGMTYGELAATLRLNPSSVGTLLARAQGAFRKEYIKRYGKTE
jgi:RNA polymerase sigma factor (sigma-70 family)